MTDNELDDLFGVVELSKPYAYTDTSTNSITPRPQVLLLPIVQSLSDELLAWSELAPMEEGNKEVGLCKEGSPCQQLSRTSTPSTSVFFI